MYNLSWSCGRRLDRLTLWDLYSVFGKTQINGLLGLLTSGPLGFLSSAQQDWKFSGAGMGSFLTSTALTTGCPSISESTVRTGETGILTHH
jgi:hypothetical protein